MIAVGVAKAYFNVIEYAVVASTPTELTDFTLIVPPTNPDIYLTQTRELSALAEPIRDPMGNVHLNLDTGDWVAVGTEALALYGNESPIQGLPFPNESAIAVTLGGIDIADNITDLAILILHEETLETETVSFVKPLNMFTTIAVSFIPKGAR